MKRTSEVLVTALAALLFGSTTLPGADGTWVTAGGRTLDVHAARGMHFVAEEGGEAFDLSELRDGETRTFGQGAKQLTAQRVGDVVTLTRSPEGDGKALEITCNVPRDACSIVTFDDEPEKVMIVIEKRHECVNGAGDCDGAIDVSVDHPSAGGTELHAVVHRVECDEAAGCAELEEVIGHGSGGIQIFDDAGTGGSGKVMIVRSGGAAEGQVLLRCPEGDATLHVAADEADDSFLCPKHSVRLERAGASLIRVRHDD
jgi:hypothetical protein